MIISCEQCHTRFKVGDDKFANGPIRVRCSKCNHVFQSAGGGAGSSTSPAIPAPSAATPAPGSPPRSITGLFPSPDPTSSSPSMPPQGGGFGAPSNRSGIFRPPTSAGMPAFNPAALAPATTPNALSGSTTSMAPAFGTNPLSQAPGSSLPATSVNPLSQPPSTSLPPTSIMAKPPGAADPDPFRGLDTFGRKPTPGLVPARAPTPDPFAPRATPSAQASSSPSPTFTPKPASADPFGGAASTSAQTPSSKADPFAGLGTMPGRPPSNTGLPSPFGTMSPSPAPSSSSAQPLTRAPSSGGAPSPFGTMPPSPTPMPMSPSSSSPSADPFAAIGNPNNARSATKDPFAGFGAPSTTPSPNAPAIADPFRPPSQITIGAAPSASASDPFAVTDAMSASSLFGPPGSAIGAPSSPKNDPFGASSAAAAKNDPFGGPTLDNGQNGHGDNGIAIDIDAAGASIDAPPPSEGMIGKDASKPQSSAPASSDPFGGLDEPAQDAQSLFDAPPPALPRAQTQVPAPAPAAPASAFAAPPRTDPRAQQELDDKLRKAESKSRVREVLWAAAQVVLALAFLGAAVVIGRGGSVNDVVKGDWKSALGGASAGGDLVVEQPAIARRTLPSGIDAVVVTGTVHNVAQKPVGGALVNVKFGSDGKWAQGWAWNVIDGTEVDGIVYPGDAAVLSTRGPKSPTMNPGDSAPFAIVVVPAPQEGLKATFVVQAAPARAGS